MARLPGFIGGYGQDRFLTFDAERTENLFLRGASAGQTPKAGAELIKRPCLQPFCALPAGPVRALFHQDGRCFGVGGGTFSEIFADGLVGVWGTVLLDGNPATISSNGTAGNQLFITSGGLGYTFDLVNNDLLQITDASFPLPALMGGFSDGYFIALKGQSRQFYISTLEDGTAWNGLDVGEVSTTSENIQSLLVYNRLIWLFGSKTTQPWYDSGNAGFPYQPVQDTLIQQGIAAPFSAIGLDNTVWWLGTNDNGGGIVFRANGYVPERVSTYAVETYLNQLERFDNAIGWAMSEEGHLWYLLYLPNADETLVYDVSSGQWFLWCVWSRTWLRNFPHLGRCHASAFGHHLVGDRQSGAIYTSSLEHYGDRLVVGGGF